MGANPTYQGFSVEPTTTLEEFCVAFAAWDAPNKSLIRPGLRRELSAAVDGLRHRVARIEAHTEDERSLSEAAQWLVDNFYVIERTKPQLSLALSDSALVGLPAYQQGLTGPRRARIELLAHFYLQACDFDFDAQELIQVLGGYQRKHALSLKELSVLAPMLNHLLIQELERCAAKIVDVQRASQLADQVADARLKRAGRHGVGPPLSEPDLSRQSTSFRQAYLGQLGQRFRYDTPEALRDPPVVSDPAAADDHAAAIEEDLVARTLLDVRVRNIFRSLRAVELSDWAEVFSQTSLVDRALMGNSVYAAMDAGSRSLYREQVELLSLQSGMSEPDLAEWLVERQRRARGGEDQPLDVGDALLGDGRRELERELSVRRSAWRRLRWHLPSLPLWAYLGAVFALTVLTVAMASALGVQPGRGASAWWLSLLALWPASAMALHVVNRVTWSWVRPARLPRLNFDEGLPADCKTMVVVPTLLSHASQVHEQVRELERHHLSNRDAMLRFALLTDWADADTEHLLDDEALLGTAREAIAQLNQRHPLADGGAEQRFSLIHRRRVWNAAESAWMGWERKRGKLEEFNRLLLGERDTTHVLEEGERAAVPTNVRYVLTLDSDTRLPVGAVSKLVGTAAHPMNRACLDEAKGRVVRGYALFQPRVAFVLPAAKERSLFRWLFSTGEGVDPYAGAVSDLYQDVFGEASYTGKGLYDLSAFQRAMAGRVPDNSLLSHDLFESAFARCALVSDVALFEDSPSHSEVAAARSHRWVRGDWQLLPWLLGLRRRGLTGLNRWKMWDNLRRSLLPVASWLLIVAACADPMARPWVWIGLVLLSIALPGVMGWLSAVAAPVPKGDRSNRPVQLARQLLHVLVHVLAEVVLLAQHAWVMADAIGRALWRSFVSRRHLLEWRTAAQVKAAAGGQLQQFSWALSSATTPVIVSAGLILWLHRDAILWAAPLLLVWWLAPVIAVTISSSRWFLMPSASGAEQQEFRRVARRTWRFFERYVGAADHHLPPDNVQFEPEEVVAHRTSPTNMGLYLLAVCRARDVGWLSSEGMLGRVSATLYSMLSLERYQGHWLNWYETRGMRALEPKYVSSVDSGNLAGHLVVLAQACRAMTARPLVGEWCLRGARDTWVEMDALWRSSRGPTARGNVMPLEIDRALRHIGDCLRQAVPTMTLCAQHLREAKAHADQLKELLSAYEFEESGSIGSLVEDSERLCAELDGHMADLRRCCPWALSPSFQSLREQHPAVFEGGLHDALDAPVPASQLPGLLAQVMDRLARARSESPEDRQLQAWSEEASLECAAASDAVADWLARLSSCARTAETAWREMNFRFLFDEKRKLFSIGYRVAEHQLDEGRYDLLASESRLGSYLAAAKGDVPVEHWFRLGRHLGLVEAGPVLISWSGSMFEYLMPCLVMKTPPGSLLHQTCMNAVREQIRYGQVNSVPWGISESGINVRDVELTYQYGPSGVPSLSLKRGMDRQLVIAPYASAMAAGLAPQEVARNFTALAGVGALGPLGFYEAIDFTAERLGDGQHCAVVRSHMAHHQAMALLGLTATISEHSLVELFHAEPEVNAFDLLLQEQVAGAVSIARDATVHHEHLDQQARHSTHRVRRFHGTQLRRPVVHLMSNGRYGSAVNFTGSGYSECAQLDITRYREDRVVDESGLFIYLRDAESHRLWSSTLAPTFREPDHYAVEFGEARAQFDLDDDGIHSSLEVVVAQQEDAEVRTLKLSNESGRLRRIEVCALTEVVLAPRNADLAHPAFSNLFITTEFDAARQVLIATRRPRADHERATTVVMGVVLEGGAAANLEYDTDRRVVIGRGRSKREPRALAPHGRLMSTVGAVLDPVLCLRHMVELPPGASVRLSLVMSFGADKDTALRSHQRLASFSALQREVSRSWVYAQAKLHQLGVSSDEAASFQGLAGYLMHSDPTFRPGRELMRGNHLSKRAMWRYGISGDRPIVLLAVEANEDLPLVGQLIRALQFWRSRSFPVDVVIVNDRGVSYADDLQHGIEARVRQAGVGPEQAGGMGAVYVLRGDRLPEDERRLLMTVCRVFMRGGQGMVHEQMRRRAPREPHGPMPAPARPTPVPRGQAPVEMGDPERLEFFNGLGGFADEGREYRVVLSAGRATPAPWVNVMASPHMGTLVSESGSSFSWRLNARENQLTPWSNDALVDPSSELIYVQDKNTRAFWTPTALPRRVPDAVYECAHGAGYSRFRTQVDDIETELTHFVAWDKPAKFLTLSVRNRSGRRRHLTVSAVVNLVLGDSRSGRMDLVSTWASAQGDRTRLYARNPANADFGRDIAWMASSLPVSGWTCDRAEFFGHGGSLASPAALESGARLHQLSGVGNDPCWVMQVELKLAPGEAQEVVFCFGQSASIAGADESAQMCGRDANGALQQVRDRWEHLLGAVQVKTPDRARDLLLNRWLLYQTVSSRMLGRCGFYQAGGAYGFRDQLQDAMAVVHAWPDLVRQHLLRAAAQQFREGDVQHWWHPPSGKGVRTSFSDDRLWLPLVVAHYLEASGDLAVLSEQVPFLEGPVLPPHEESIYFEPTVSEERASLFEHCVRAIEVSRQRGRHGLPLMGCGDWNDGMNRVGWKGEGESVWMAWFLKHVLDTFIPWASRLGRDELVVRWRQWSTELIQAVETEAWDGQWYRRAYFDDGSPLGSAQNDECQIDSLSQSWAVIAGGGDPARAQLAMQQVEDRLVDPSAQIIKLFTPSFDKTSHDPGYIKGYVPGIRENGGQYTHAAVWTVMAFAKLGDAQRANRYYDMILPVRKSDSRVSVQRYRVEPYVMAADIYGEFPHAGKGGWTWYTGAAGWYYRVGLEDLLGFKLSGDRLHMAPCVPADWPGYELRFRFGTTWYEVLVDNAAEQLEPALRCELDGVPVDASQGVQLHNDGQPHRLRVMLPGGPSPQLAAPGGANDPS